MSCNSSYRITAEPSGRVLSAGAGLKGCTVSTASAGFLIGGKRIDSRVFKITPSRDGSLSLEGRKYRGSFRFVSNGAGAFNVINLVDLEDYLSSVLAGEMPIDWHDSALRAQAIVSRSYAIYQMKDRKNQPYDLVSTIKDQVYLGLRSETAKSRRILRETRGIIIVYKWRLFPAYFHSTCGGHTENVANVFGTESIPPLEGVRCDFCRDSKYYRWTISLSADEIRKKLSKGIGNLGAVSYIQPTRFSYPVKGDKGRATMVRIGHSSGVTEIKAALFRSLLGTSVLRSTWFQVRRSGDRFIFTGRGWGHGVGMCQCGARGMARKGYDCIDIIRHYYPKAEFVRIY